MKLYFAPLEGITTYTFRNTHAEIFGGCDTYYAPFINPSDQEKVSKKGMRDINPEKNNVKLKIQVLTNKAESFLKFEDKVRRLGYDEININIGCPATRVIQKGRGAGFLREPELIDQFLDEIFSKSHMKISVKTRIGFTSADELDKLMQIYNKHPLEMLIVHPRTREDFYKGVANINAFEKAYNVSKNKICYNGDIFTRDDFENISSRFPDSDGVMIGRGAVKNPALFREIRGGQPLSTDELIEFSERLAEKYVEVLGSEAFTLDKLKEIWGFIMENYPGEKKISKAIRKARTLSDFKAAIYCLPAL